MEFMNVSGQAVARVAGFYKIPRPSTIVVHDELDLPFGRLKLGVGGGHGGHNGVRSLHRRLGDADFARVRVGVGRPAAGRERADYVLGELLARRAKELPALIGLAADAVEAIVDARPDGRDEQVQRTKGQQQATRQWRPRVMVTRGRSSLPVATRTTAGRQPIRRR